MHHIQKSIIDRLAQSSPLRFSQLRPSNVPNNTFSYHLKKLLETGYIAMTLEGYSATRKALKILSYSTPNEKRSIHPMLLTTLFVTNNLAEVLLIRRNTQPFKYQFGAPSGLIHNSETIEQAARRELYEKTAIVAAVGSLNQCGVLDFRYKEKKSQDTFIHAIGFIYSYHYSGDPSIVTGKPSKYGELFWSKLDHANILPEVYEIAKIVSDKIPTVHSADFEEPVS